MNISFHHPSERFLFSRHPFFLSSPSVPLARLRGGSFGGGGKSPFLSSSRAPSGARQSRPFLACHTLFTVTLGLVFTIIVTLGLALANPEGP